MKILKEIKEDYAKHMGFESWEDLINNRSTTEVEIVMNRVADLYAQQYV